MIRTLSFSAAVAAAILVTGCAGDQKLFRTDAELAQKTTAAPTATVPAKTTRAAVVRASPHELAPELFTVAQGTDLLVAPQANRGWRRVKTSDGKSGYVLDAALQVEAAAANPPAAK